MLQKRYQSLLLHLESLHESFLYNLLCKIEPSLPYFNLKPNVIFALFYQHEQDHDELTKYIPRSASSVILMLSIFLGLQGFAVAIHSLFLPTVGQRIPSSGTIIRLKF